MSEEIDVTEVRAAFDDAMDAGKDEESVKLDMIGAGATFKTVTKLFNQFMVDSGRAVSKEQKDQMLADVMGEADASTEEGLQAAIESLVAASDGAITEKGAATSIRAYCKRNELECYKKPKAASVRKDTFRDDFLNALVANPEMTEEEAEAYIMEHGNPTAIKIKDTYYQKFRACVNRVHAEKVA